MESSPATKPDELDPKRTFYRGTLQALKDAHVPFLVGGAYALRHYTNITRETKDMDLFVRPKDIEYALDVIAAAGYRTELTFSHWIGKALYDDYVVDLIFNSGNGISEVDEAWFDHASQGEIFGVTVTMCPAEEIVWSKAFIMERGRFDGADIMHLLLIYGDRLNWQRLLDRFGPYWRILLIHLILFGFIYPGERNRIPAWIMHELLRRMNDDLNTPPPEERVCLGTLLSHLQYRIDVDCWGFKDARLLPKGSMTREEIECWTAAFEPDRKK